jgi:hypothetical protein
MTLELDSAPKRTRESTSKVRTGCSTCKARRVKCDESKPTCRRCAKGGRECDYNVVHAVLPPRNVITVYLPPTQTQPTLFPNYRGLDFFHQNVAAKLDGHFDTSFWSKLVLQLSHSESSIRHAVSAISVIYKDVESPLQHSTGYANTNYEAQREWNTAMKCLSARIQAHPNSNLVPLACCLLFTCIEFLKGNGEASMLHIQSGLGILGALRRNSDAGLNFSSSDGKAIQDYIIPIFSRLSVIYALAGRTTSLTYAFADKMDSPQENIADSRRRLAEISNTCLRFISKAGAKAAMFQIDVNDLIQQTKLQTRLEAWRNQLDELCERLQAAGNSVKQDALNLLLVQYKVIYIWMRVCVTAGELATDSYHADFEEFLHYAEQLARPGAAMATPQPLSFELQTLAPLYYVALKCRHLAMRRRALELLRLAPRREGLWNGHYAFVTAKRIIELEETQLNDQGLPDETVRVHGLPLPDNESLVCNLGAVPRDSKKLIDGIVLGPASAGMLKAEFQTKPWGLLGDWHTITEYIEL